MRRALLLIGALLLALARPAGAQSGDSLIVIHSYDTELLVQLDGVVDVTETIRFEFVGKWNGILRDLSLNHHTAEGKREKLQVEVVSVTDERGRALRMEPESPDGWMKRLRIYVPGAHNAQRTIVIRYRVKNAIRFYFAQDTAPGFNAAGFDELYWNVTGNDWTMPIGRASARVVLPPNAVPTRMAVYTGYAGSTGRDAEIVVDSARKAVTFTTTRAMAEGEGLTVAVGWPPGTISSRPSDAEHQRLLAAQARAERMRLWPLGLPLLAFWLGLSAWRRRGRDPKELSITVQYEPPDAMSPAEMGTLVDHEAEMRDVISTLVDLAVRGYVGIEERVNKHLFGLITNTEYVFHLRKPREEWSGLAAHEERFLDALFSIASAEEAWDDIRATFAEARRVHEAGGQLDREAFSTRLASAGSRPTSSVKQSDLTNRFYKSLPGIKDAIYDKLVERGYYLHRPDKVKGNWLGLGIAALVLGLVGAAFLAGSAPGWISPFALGVGAGISAVVLIGFGLLMPARTHAGARAREASLGFREFLERVESERYRMMITSPEMFERYLPYAMAFGVEKRWARAFDDLYREPPDWYSGSGYGHFRASDFTARMSTMTAATGSSMQSSPSSSGSGGGGSSGGGSGGGGGSGF